MAGVECYYRLDGPTFEWGSFGSILIAGYFDTDPEGQSSEFGLLRSGPFVPPISFPGSHCVVTSPFRAALAASGLRGVAFRPVLKRRIVEIPWETWDRTAELEPWQLPESGPEGCLLEREHSPVASEQVGELWDLTPPGVERDPTVAGWIFPRRAVGSLDFFVDSLYDGPIFASERAKQWLESHADEWVLPYPVAVAE